MYLIISRPDIVFVMNLMAWFMQRPYVEHLNAIKQILRYVVGIKDLALKYSKVPLVILSGFLDFDYGGDRNDRKSTSAYVFSIDSSAISWVFKKQPIVTLSTTKVKYRAIFFTTQEAIWLSHLLKEIGYEMFGPSLISSYN